MTQSSIPLTELTETQRTQAQTRFTIIRPALEDGITAAQVARTQNIPAPTVRRWMKHYREKGFAGLPMLFPSLKDLPYKPLSGQWQLSTAK